MLTYLAIARELELSWGWCRPSCIYRNKESCLNSVNNTDQIKINQSIFVSNKLVSDTMMFLRVRVGRHRFCGGLVFVANAVIL